jgi:SAM-dependent methyltransferase
LTRAYERARVVQNDELRDVQRFFDGHFQDRRLRRVLDAGAGFNLPLDIPRSAHLVAIDLDPAALARNENADEKLVGDIEQLDLTGLRDFDAIICWWVLEHTRTPSAAVAQLANVLRPGGLLILGVPYYWGFKSVVTKLTPFWFHLYMARREDPLAGTPGYGPYPTNLRRDISPKALDRIAAQHRLTGVFQLTYSLQPEERLSRPARGLWVAAGKLVHAITLGRYNPLLSEHIAIYERR